jgi:prophage regulatory protein
MRQMRNHQRDPMSVEILTPRAAADRILRLPQVCKMTGLRRSFVYELQAERRFPQSIKLGARAVGWLEGEIQAWIVARIESSRGSAQKRTGSQP